MSGLSVRVRFEVFKRDRFTCSYCGRHAPDVLLECDHIVPHAAGGSDDISNLTTSCVECNAGKSDRLLEEGTAPAVARQVVDDLRERLEQAAAYTELVGQQDALLEKQVHLIYEMWARVFRARVGEGPNGPYWYFEDGAGFPDERSVRLFLRRLPMHEIVEAIDYTAARFDQPFSSTCRFFYKICWNRIKAGNQSAVVPEADELQSAVFRANDELQSALNRIDELEEENADLRAIISTLREDRSKGPWESLGQILRRSD